jgi:hypothetical protein
MTGEFAKQGLIGDFYMHHRRGCTFLLYLASGGYHRQVGFAQGIAKSTAILQDIKHFLFIPSESFFCSLHVWCLPVA